MHNTKHHAQVPCLFKWWDVSFVIRKSELRSECVSNKGGDRVSCLVNLYGHIRLTH